MKALTILASTAVAAATLLAFAPEASASIKDPHDHPDYKVELEPHITSIFVRYRYAGRKGGRAFRTFGDPEWGAGFRASIELGDPLFVPSINNTIGITFGIDTTDCRYCYRDFWIWSPVALQWNFFFHKRFSAFADIGGVIRSDGFLNDVFIDPAFMVGGRVHFNDKVSFTFRGGIPFFNLGVSFFI